MLLLYRGKMLVTVFAAASALVLTDSIFSTVITRRKVNKTEAAVIQGGSGPDKAKVYQAGEVDKETKLRNDQKVFKDFQPELKCQEGRVKLMLLLHKSGKVTDVKIDGTPNCKITEKGLLILRRLKFVPAIKDGAKVSEYLTVELKRETATQAPMSNATGIP